EQDTDFGITLGTWGAPEGAYLVLPFLGPTLARGLPAYVVDRAFSPMTYLGYWGPFKDVSLFGPSVRLVGIVDKRAAHSDLVDELFYDTPDPYVTLRAAYVQRRRAKVAGPKGVVENLPDI